MKTTKAQINNAYCPRKRIPLQLSCVEVLPFFPVYLKDGMKHCISYFFWSCEQMFKQQENKDFFFLAHGFRRLNSWLIGHMYLSRTSQWRDSMVKESHSHHCGQVVNISKGQGQGSFENICPVKNIAYSNCNVQPSAPKGS